MQTVRCLALVMGAFAIVVPTKSAFGQLTASGEAYSTRGELLGAPILVTGDTRSNGFDPGEDFRTDAAGDQLPYADAADGEIISLPPIAIVNGDQPVPQSFITGDPDDVSVLDAGFVGALPGFAISHAGASTADVVTLGIGTPLVQVATRESDVFLSCQQAQVSSGVDLLVIAGTPVEVPGTGPTTIVNATLPLIEANQTEIDVFDFTDDDNDGCGITVTQTALHIQVADTLIPGVLDLKFSGASATLDNIDCGCPVLGLVVDKTGAIVSPNAPPADRVNDGDRVRFTMTARSGTPQQAMDLIFVDRLPQNATLDEQSVRLNGSPIPATVAQCPANLSFPAVCPAESSIESDRDCMTISTGDLAPGSTATVSFEMVADDGEGVCNAFLTTTGNFPIAGDSVILAGVASTPTPTPTAVITVTPTPTIPGGTGGTAGSGGTGGTAGTGGTGGTAGSGGSGGSGGTSGRARCDEGDTVMVRRLAAASGTLNPGGTASGGSVQIDHNCSNGTVNLQQITLALSGNTARATSIQATALKGSSTATAIASVSGTQAVLTFNPPISMGSSDDVNVVFGVRSGAATAALELAGLASHPLALLAGLAVVFLVPRRSRSRVLGGAVIVLLAAGMTLAQTGCGGDDDDSGSGGTGVGSDQLNLRVVAVRAVEPSNDVVAASGLPVDLGNLQTP